MRSSTFNLSMRPWRLLAAPSLAIVVVALGACAVTEERASAMEQRIGALEQADTDTRLVALMERLSAVEAGTAEAIATMRDELAGRNAPPAPAPTEPPAPKTTAEPANPSPVIQPNRPVDDGGSPDSIWVAIDTVLGVERTPIAVEDNLYRVSRAWLRQQVDAMATTGHYPRIVAAKKGGVQIKGMRPESLGGQLGFKGQDIITAIDGKGVNTVDDVAAALRAAGDRVEVVVKRRREESIQVYVLVE